MTILQAATSSLVNLAGSLPLRISLMRPDNMFETHAQAMFADEEPRDNGTREAEWRARYYGVQVQEDPDTSFYELLDDLSKQLAVAQGLRGTYRFGDKAIQNRIMRAEDKLRDVIETLYSVRPDEKDLLTNASSVEKDIDHDVPPSPALIIDSDNTPLLTQETAQLS